MPSKPVSTNRKKWLYCLNLIVMSFCGAQYAVTGKSPYEMMFGCQMTFLMQLRTK